MSSPKGGHLPSEGAGRVWRFPSGADKDPTLPMCIVKGKIVVHGGGGLSDAASPRTYFEYIVGADVGMGGGKNTDRSKPSKGLNGGLVTAFCSHEMSSKDKDPFDRTSFARRWLERDPSLMGDDAAKLSQQNAWAAYIMRKTLIASRGLRSNLEQRHFQLEISPEIPVGNFLRDSGRVVEFGRRFMAQLELDYGGRLYWVAADHYNRPHTHIHVEIRGIDVQGFHVFIPWKPTSRTPSYMRPTDAEKAADPMASSPIEFRARRILRDMIEESKGARHAG